MIIYSDLAIAGAFIKSLDKELIFGILLVVCILCLSAPSNINKLCLFSFKLFIKFKGSLVLLNFLELVKSLSTNNFFSFILYAKVDNNALSYIFLFKPFL